MGKLKSVLSFLKNIILNHKKLSILLIVIIILIAIVFRPKNIIKIDTETVTQGNLVKTISVTGKISSENIANLSFLTGGKLSYLGATEGDVVKKWQAIASIDRTLLDATVRQTFQDFNSAKASSEKYYDQHQNIDVETYDQRIQRTAIDATQNKAYDQYIKAQYDLNNSTLYSPIDGVLTRSDAKTTGVNITAATVFTITDPKALILKMEVDEADIGNIRNNQKIKVNFDAFPDENINLIVSKIDLVSHTTTTGGNAYYVQAKINYNEKFKIGMNGNAEIIVNQVNDIKKISLSDLVDDQYVFVKNKDKYKKTKVILGLENDTTAQVISGLNMGDEVVLDPTTVPQDKIIK